MKERRRPTKKGGLTLNSTKACEIHTRGKPNGHVFLQLLQVFSIFFMAYNFQIAPFFLGFKLCRKIILGRTAFIFKSFQRATSIIRLDPMHMCQRSPVLGEI